MSPVERDSAPLLSPRRIIWQLLGFTVGVGLLVWCVVGAVRGGGWEQLANADPLLLFGMTVCTLVSMVINGATFWITLAPLKRLNLLDLQLLNVIANMLNYAPIRLGALMRVLYHNRVDGLSILTIGAWFLFIGGLLAIGVGACVLATVVHPALDVMWFIIALASIAACGLTLISLSRSSFMARSGRGFERMAADPRAVWGGLVLRLADIAAYAGRMALAVKVLEIHMSASQTVLLAVAALAAGLVPFGRLGFREALVAATGLTLVEGDPDANMKQLALLESAGEAIVFIPLGAISLLWLRTKWRLMIRRRPTGAIAARAARQSRITDSE